MTLAAIEAIAAALQAANVRYLVVGGLAVNAYGYDRVTLDIDVVIQLDRANVAAAFSALASVDFHPHVPITAQQFGDRNQRETLIRDKNMVVLNFWSDRFRGTTLDVFVAEPFDFDAEYQQALVEILSPELVLRFPKLETLITMKLAAGRPKDLIDVEYLRKLSALE